MRPEDVPDQLIAIAADAVTREFGPLCGLRCNRSVEPCATECKETLDFCRHALAAVIPLVQAAEREACAKVAEAHIPPECPVWHSHDEWAKGYNEAMRCYRDNAIPAIRARNTP